jgi:ribonuclease HII
VLQFERISWAKGFEQVCGVDEAGRGPLAGPVVAAAVIFPKEFLLPGVDDSKKLKESQREALFPLIMRSALAVGVGVVSAQVIDQINILEATFQAMREAIAELSIVPEYVLVDGNKRIKCYAGAQEAIVKGDSRSQSIAAASIIAKVTRDRMMHTYSAMYPEYSLQTHKGYPTRLHYAAVNAYGPSPIHRLSFRGVNVLPNLKLQEQLQLQRLKNAALCLKL